MIVLSHKQAKLVGRGEERMITNRCKDLRGDRTQSTIAALLGITQQQYSNIENSSKPPTIDMCIKLSKIYEKPVDYIFPQIFLNTNTSLTCEK